MRCARLSRALLLGLLAHPSVALADDWLVELPDCGERAVPGVSLIYPRAGLPALVNAGSMLVVRVTQPTALTPPPGIQQPRALTGWSAALVPRALAVPGTPPAAHQASERVPVVDVRPDGPSSLRYRAKLTLAPWLAPASYDLRLSTPGGRVALAGAVRVLPRGAAARLVRARASQLGMPFDVVVTPSISSRPAGGPLSLVPQDVVASLRLGARLWMLGTCRDAGGAAAAQSANRDRARSGEPPIAVAPELALPVRVTERAGQLVIEASAELDDAAELDLLADGHRAVRVDGGRVAWFPMGDGPDAVVGRLRLQPGARASVRYATDTTPALAATLHLPPNAKVGAPVRLAVRGGPEGARVGWRLGEAQRRFGPPHAEHVFRRSGPIRVTAVVVDRDGRTQRLQGQLRVAGPGGCAGTGCGLVLPLALPLVALASKTRRRRRLGIDYPPPIV